MADVEAKAKAEKLAAAKKRVEQLKKQKAKKAEAAAKKEETVLEEPKDGEVDAGAEAGSSKAEDAPNATDDDKASTPNEDASNLPEDTTPIPPTEGRSKHIARQPYLSIQSKMRSSSFRQGAAGGPGSPMSPSMLSAEGDTAHEIHRRQQAKIEELEKENKRLAKDSSEGERRWKKAEEDLEELRDADTESKSKAGASPSPPPSDEVQNLKSQIAALERHNGQLQAQVAARPSRHASSPSISHSLSPPLDHSAELASKSSTIESMELEISNLRAQLARTASGSTAEKEQIGALEEKLARTAKALESSQHELVDLKKNLERTTEKAVKEGSSRTSAETKLRTLEREADEAKKQAEDLTKKVEALEKKITTLTTLHKEHDARSQALKKERERADKDATELRSKLAGVENENLRCREELERARKRNAEGVDDDGVDDLESDARHGLERKIRELEAEVSDLKRGLWRESRKELDGPGSPGALFTDVDLSVGSPGQRKRNASASRGGLGEMLNYGIHALTGGGQQGGGQGHKHEHDGLLEDEDEEFDEEAWRKAQEEEGKRRIERVREVKRGLEAWRGWRLDLVEVRRGGGEGERLGEVFEV